MNAQRDPDRLIHAFLMEGATELADQVYDAVRDRIEQQRQRVVIGPWRMPTMNKFVPIGLGAAAVVVALVVGTQLLGPPAARRRGRAPHRPSRRLGATPRARRRRRRPGWSPRRPVRHHGTDAPVQITVDIASPGWPPLPDSMPCRRTTTAWTRRKPSARRCSRGHGRPGPASTCTAIPASGPRPSRRRPPPRPTRSPRPSPPRRRPTRPRRWTSPWAGSPARRSRSPCRCRTTCRTRPGRKSSPIATRAMFAFYGIEGRPEVARNAQGAGQIDELWILDVDGSI